MDPQLQPPEWEPLWSPTLLSGSSSRRDHKPSPYPPIYPCIAVIPYPHAVHAMSTPDIPPPPERIVQPPRPPNAWILYRSDKLRQLPPTEPGNPRRAQAEVSKMISNMWKNESEAVRNEYERRADAKKAEHQQMYPNYRFQPMKKEEKERMRTEKRTEKEKERTQSKKTRHRTTPYIPSTLAASLPAMIPLFNPERHFGPNGPSPPMSAASSPEDDSPLREVQTTSEPSSSYLPAISPISVSPTTHSFYPPGTSSSHRKSKHVMVPAPLTSQWWPAVQSSRSSSSASSVCTSPTRPVEKSSQIHPENDNEGVGIQFIIHSISQVAHNCVVFFFVLQDIPYNAPVLPQQPSAEWSSDDLSSLQAFLSATDDPSIFELSNISPELLLTHPTGQLEVSMGTDLLSYDPPSEDYTALAQEFFGSLDLPEIHSSSHSSADFASPLSSPAVAEAASKASSTVSSGGDDSDILSLFATGEDQRSLGGSEMLEYFNFEPQYAQTVASPLLRSQPPIHKSAMAPLMESKEPNVTTPYYSSANAKTIRRSTVAWKQKFPGSDEENPPLEPFARWGVSAR
jgi:hypothetical protein